MLAISENKYVELLDLTCEAALEPAAWEKLLRRLAHLTGCVAGGLTFEDPETGTGQPLVHFGFDPDHVTRTFSHYLPQNPLFAIKDRMHPGVVVTNGMVVPERRFRRSEFYDGWARPQGLCSPVTVVLHRDGLSYSPLTLVRPDRSGDVSEQHFALLQRLAPHLVRAFSTGLVLERLGSRAGTFGEALSRLAVAAFILDARSRVIYASPAAERLLSADAPLFFVRNGTLGVCHGGVSAALQAAVMRAQARAASVDSVAIPPAADREPMLVHVLPIRRQDRSLIPGSDVLITVSPLNAGNLTPQADTLVGLFDLTPAEARIAAALATGRSLKEAASSQGIRVSTARSYLEHIFQKTGTHRQSQLVALLKSARPLSCE